MAQTNTQQANARNEINFGIMSTKIDNIEGSIEGMRQDIKDLANKIDSNYVTRVEHVNLERRVVGIESSMSWIVRLIVGIVITAVLGLIVVSK